MTGELHDYRGCPDVPSLARARRFALPLFEAVTSIHELGAVLWDRDSVVVPEWASTWSAGAWDEHYHPTLGHGCVTFYDTGRHRAEQWILGPDLRWYMAVRLPSALGVSTFLPRED